MSEHFGLSHMIVYLAAAVLCVPLAARLKLGSVLGYLAAGCVIGPFGLKVVREPAATLHVAEIGVVFMLFVIGLELDPKRLWQLRRSVFGSGSLQLTLCGATLTLCLLAFGLPWQGAIVAGFALALSSTAVALQTLRERDLASTELGRSAFAILLFQDIAAIPLVAIVPALAVEDHPDAPAASIVKIVAALAFVLLTGRYLVPLLLRVVARTHIREVFTAATLLLVLGVAWLMTEAGISQALGAFLAGVLLAGSEYRHALETDIEPFKGLLMGLFFIAVGMSIDFGLLQEQPVLVLGLLSIFQLSKGIVLQLLGRVLHLPKGQGWLFSALLVQGGEFAFVVFGVAHSARLLPGRWDALLTLTVALSMALSPILVALEERLLALKSRRRGRSADVIDSEYAPVVIAGFGRFGQIVGRLLFASRLRATVLDHDPDQIDLLRRFGFRVYYGDATRLDLLEAAGADRARVLVNAIDDPTASLALVDAVRERFPTLPIIARARDVNHYYELRSRGVNVVERETFESALRIGRKTLEALGVKPYEARERADRFRHHNLELLESNLPTFRDQTRVYQIVRQATQELERQFEEDVQNLERDADGWHELPIELTVVPPRAD